MKDFIINNIIPFLSNREWATVIWFIILLIWVCHTQSVRNVLKRFFAFKLLFINLIAYTYLIAWVVLFYKLEFWTFSLLKDTAIYVFFTSIALIFDTISNKNENKFKKLIVDNIKFTTIIVLYLDFYSFNFWIEMFLVPILCFFAIYTEKEKNRDRQKVHRFVSIIIIMTGLSILLYCLYRTYQNYYSILSKEFIESLLLPIVFTILYIPYLYFLSLYSEYELWFINLLYRTQVGKEYRFRKKLILRYCGINLSKIRFISKNFHIYTMLSQKQFEAELQEWNNKYKHRIDKNIIN
jgi:hypothetical protein